MFQVTTLLPEQHESISKVPTIETKQAEQKKDGEEKKLEEGKQPE